MSLVTKYYLITALHNAYFPLAIWTLYFVEQWNFSFTQTMLLFVVTFATSTILDLFGGMYADAFGRKRSVVIGYALELIGITSVILIDNFLVLIVCSVLTGIGAALISGSLDALVADELGVDSLKFKRTNGLVQMYLFLARVVASIIGGWLYLQDERFPFIAYGVMVLCSLIVASTLHDNHIVEKAHERSAQFKELLSLIRGSAVIQRVWFGLFLGTFAGDLIWVYYQPFYKSIGWSGFDLGILFACISLLSASGSWLVSKFHEVLTPQNIFKIAALATALNGLLFLSGYWVLSLVGVAFMAVKSGMVEPATRSYFSSVSTNKNRATMLSLGSSAGGLGILVGFMLSGILLDAGLHKTLLTCVVVAACVYFVVIQTTTFPKQIKNN
jgi:MFS family permease